MTKYYTVSNSADEKIIGAAYPQCHSFVKGITEEDEERFYNFDEYFNKKECLPPFELKLDGYKFYYRCKLTNFISHVSSKLLLMDKTALDLMLQFNLGQHIVIPATVYKSNNPLELFFLYIANPIMQYIDFPKCIFEVNVVNNCTKERYTGFKDYQSLRDFKKMMWNSNENYFSTQPIQLILSSDFPTQLDVFRIPYFNAYYYFMSDRLKNAIEEAELTGLNFSEEIKIAIEK